MRHTYHRKLALVTGASSGIGLELARNLASHDFDLMIAAENAAIFAAARELESSGASVEAVQVDLATPAGVEELLARIEAAGRPLSAVALNAGVGTRGGFATGTALETELLIIDLNVRSTVHLAKHVVSDMVKRGEGRILVTSSVAANEPGAFQAIYNASKSFVQSFSLALSEELDGTGVTVTTLMPGPTDTPFFERANIPDSHVATLRMVDPAAVARAGVEALMNGDRLVVTTLPPPTRSLSNRFRSRIGRVLPRRVKASLRRTTSNPGSA